MREIKLNKIRNKWLETVKYTGMLEDEEQSENAAESKSGASPIRRRGTSQDKKNYSDEELVEIFNRRLASDQIDVP